MLWINNIITPNTCIDFYQVFIDSNIEYNDNKNIIYSFESSNLPNIKNLKKIECINKSYTIKTMDQLISYTDIIDNKTIVFSHKMKFIEPSNNKLNIPIFNFSYKNVNNNRMPNLIDSSYNFISNLTFQIYKFSDKVQFIIETNPETNITKKYWITLELSLLNNYLK
jgi:hypothetical protein